MRRANCSWLLAVLIPLGLFLVVLGVATNSRAPFGLVLLVAATLSIIYMCVPVGRLSWRLLRGRPLRPLVTKPEVIGWLMSVFATVLVIGAVLPSLLPRSGRLAKAQSDTRALATATVLYHEQIGRLPETLDDLTRRVTTAKGQEVGPFIEAIPSPPHGWSPYRYERRPDGEFSIHSQGAEGEARVSLTPDRAEQPARFNR